MRQMTRVEQGLIAHANRGGMTVVLGAGVSLACRIPNWEGLARRLWDSVLRTSQGPWPLDDSGGKPPVEALAGFPQFLPFVFELAANRLGRKFIPRLRELLYQEATPLADRAVVETAGDTLAVTARMLRADLARNGARRIIRVITFNVDDLLEQAIETLWGERRRPPVKVIARASQHPYHGCGDQAIPVYHLHGCLPQRPNARKWEPAPDTLVFTDAQYWASSANPLSFANRVMATALHDSHCLFIGCSMTDLNLIRWLGLRFNEMKQDKTSQIEAAQEPWAEEEGPGPVAMAQMARASLRGALRRHFWITDRSAPAFITRCLELRGVDTVRIRSWSGPDYADLTSKCFPP